MATITVGAGDDLQRALNTARSGDEVVLAAGATFEGPFLLPPKDNPEQPVLVRGSQAPPDRRVTLTDAGPMPKLNSRYTEPVLGGDGACGFKFQGLNILPTQYSMYNMVYTDATAHHLAFDRCVFLGDAVTGQKNALALNGGHMLVERCHIDNIWYEGDESHGFVVWTGPGPFTVRDNYIAAASINILIGGAHSGKPEWLPADLLIEDNHLAKRPEWLGKGRGFKNLFELKGCRRVVCRRNLMEFNREEAQSGWGVLFTTRSEPDETWATIEDVLFESNVIRDSLNGLNIGGTNDGAPSGQAKNLRVLNNVWDLHARALMIAGECTDVVVDHNTIFNADTLWIFTGGYIWPNDSPVPRETKYAVKNLTYTNNLGLLNEYGVFGDYGKPWREYVAGSLNWTNNVLANRDPQHGIQEFPGLNWYPTRAEHEDQFEANYKLKSSSVYLTRATDGGQLGVRTEFTPPPEPPDPEPPPTGTTTVNILRVVRNGKSPNYTVEVDVEGPWESVQFLVDGQLAALVTVEPLAATVKIAKPGKHTLTVQALVNGTVVGEAVWTIQR